MNGNQTDPIRVVVILGSVRPGSATGRLGRALSDALESHDGVSVDLIDPAQIDIPLPGVAGDSPVPAQLQDVVRAADGVLLVSPEYHGSYSSVIKLIIDNLGFPSTLGGKPVSLVGGAGAMGATKALEHLRGVAAHVGAHVLPKATSIANVQQIFNGDGHIADVGVEERLHNAATALLDFIHAFGSREAAGRSLG